MRIIFAGLTLAALTLTPLAASQAQTAGTEVINAAPASSAAPGEPAAPAGEYARNQGWNSQWALLFELNNILTVGNFLSSFNASPANVGVGGRLHLSPEMAARVTVSASRSSNPPATTKTVGETGTEDVTTYGMTRPNPTESWALRGDVDLLYRLMPNAVAPYVGAGLNIGWTLDRQAYEDKIAVPDQTTTEKRNTSFFGLGLRGIVGAEWRVHPNFSLFAEYALTVMVCQVNSVKDVQVIENSIDGQRTASRTTVTTSTPRWFNYSTGLAQGGQLGLAVHF
jgi:hypothetical protein